MEEISVKVLSLLLYEIYYTSTHVLPHMVLLPGPLCLTHTKLVRSKPTCRATNKASHLTYIVFLLLIGPWHIIICTEWLVHVKPIKKCIYLASIDS